MPDPSYYQILGVDPQSSEEEIEAAYRSLLAENFTADGSYKPGAKDTVEMISRAYVVLTDPVRRKQYDYERFWGKTEPAGGGGAEKRGQSDDPSLPGWLAAEVETEKTPFSRSDEEVVEWLKRKEQASRSPSTGRFIIFMALLIFLVLTLLMVIMTMLSR